MDPSSSSCLVPGSSFKRKRDPSSSFNEHNRCKRPKYDVLLNFSVEDTGNKFVSHLIAALKSKCFNTFDHTTLPIGQDMSYAQLKAIEESHTYFVVFSPKFALSVEFFEKLVLIMDSVSKFNDRKVIPVFLNVNPSDVRKLQGCFEEDFRTHETNVDSQTLNKWKQAVTHVGGLSGLVLEKGDDESDFIKKIIQDLMKIKIPEELFDAKYPVGIEKQKQAIISELRLGDKEFSNTVAVVGMSGSGKTTVVKAVYDTIVAEFDSSCFIKNIHFYKNSGPKWKVKLQREVLRSLTGDDSFHNNASTTKIKRHIENNKSLVVLDDVGKPEELEVLGIPCVSLSCSGSRVVVATGNKESLRDLTYTRHDMELLNKKDSFTLFVAHAYGEDDDDVDDEFVYEIVYHARGLPLVLVVWGKHFKAHDREEWPNLLKILKRIPLTEIQEKLRMSYDSLPDETKSFFLDIVCFFDGWKWDSQSYEDTFMEMCYYMNSYQHSMCRILNDEDELFFPEIEIKPLVDRGLVKIEYDDYDKVLRVVMHEVIREMGKEVVRQENKKEPGKRTRLVDEKDVLHVFENNSGTNSVESISFELYAMTPVDSSLELTNVVGAINKMNNLRFIKLVGLKEFFYSSSNDDVSLSFKHLKYLEWEGFPWRSINNHLDMPNVVVLVMRDSKLETLWDGKKNLKKLRILDVYQVDTLTMTGSFIGLENLEELHLNGCENLKEVDSSIICLKKLHTLNVPGCDNIKSIPNLPPSIKLIVARGCKNLVNLPSNMSELQSLRILDLSHCSNLVSEGLMRVAGLRKLQHLYMIESNMSQVSSEIGNFESLQKLYLGDNFSSLPDSLSKLSQLVHLDISYCRELRSLPLLPSKLTLIDAKFCSSLDVIPFDSMRKANVFRSKLFEESIIAKPLWINLTHKMIPEVFQYEGDIGQVLSFVAPERKIYGAILYVRSIYYFESFELRNRTKETSYEFEYPGEDYNKTEGFFLIICLLNETTLVVEAGDTVEVIGDDYQSYGFRFIYEGDVLDSTTLAIQNTINVNVTHQNTSPVPVPYEMNEEADTIAQLTDEFGFFSMLPTNQENTSPVPSEMNEAAASIAQLTDEFGFFSMLPTNQENSSPVYHVFFS